MCKKKFSMTIFVPFVFILFICFIGRASWGEEYVPNVHWVFCIDTSGSMKTKGHVDLLKEITERITHEFIDPKKNIIKIGDRITIFSFDEDVRLEATSLYQTENDLLAIKDKLKQMNERSGSLTFISEAIVQAIEMAGKYDQFFHTNALYIFTDGKSEPYSLKWPKDRILARKKQDQENFQKISLSGKEQGLNIWLGILKWEAFDDAKTFVKKMGKGGHVVDLTDFNRLSVAKALKDFSATVRTKISIPSVKDLDFGTIPYHNGDSYEKNISLAMETDNEKAHPSIVGNISFDPDNPSEIAPELPLAIKTTEDKIVLNFSLANANRLKSGKYKGKLKLSPSKIQFGALVIEPSQVDVQFKKSGFIGFYAWKVVIVGVVGLLFLIFVVNKIKRKMPIKV